MASSGGGRSAVGYLASRVWQRLVWTRTEGVRATVEEAQLNVAERARVAYAKHRWRRRHGVPAGTATAVYVVGLQRSGTNMTVRGLDCAPEFEVHNESDGRVFWRFRLRSYDTVADTIRRSRHAYVLFKPLCDSHRVTDLLALPGVPPGKAIWIYRDVDDRARSTIAKFGDNDLTSVRRIISGQVGDLWQGQRLSAETQRLLREFEPETMTTQTAAALLWYARNSLYFDLGLHGRPDVFLLSYDRLVADPEGVGRDLCRFLGLPWRQELFAHVEQRHPVRRLLPVDPAARTLCDEMRARLGHAESAARVAREAGAGMNR